MRAAGSSSQIFVIGADGTGLVRLTSETNAASFWLSWSPDGNADRLHSLRPRARGPSVRALYDESRRKRRGAAANGVRSLDERSPLGDAFREGGRPITRQRNKSSPRRP